MIVKDGNYVSYGIKNLVFDTVEQFKEYKDQVAIGSIAYIVTDGKRWILDSTNTWNEYNTGGGGYYPDEVIYDGGEVKTGGGDDELEVIYDGGEVI